jgi:hypothetical protein
MNGTIITTPPTIPSRGAIMNATVCRRLLGASVIAVVVGASGAAHASPARSEQVVLKGLDPHAYMQRRHRQPDVSQELQALPMATVLRVLRDDDAVAFAPSDAYATGLKPGVKDAMRIRERQAVKQGALLVLSRSTDPRVAAAIAAAVDDEDPAVAAIAAERLGDLRPDPAISVLKSVVADHDRAVAVRAGACAGLGRARSAEALDVLLAVVDDDDDDDNDEVVKGAALQAIALLGSRWAWEARHDVATGAALRTRAVQRLSALPLKGDVDAKRTAVVQQLR